MIPCFWYRTFSVEEKVDPHTFRLRGMPGTSVLWSTSVQRLRRSLPGVLLRHKGSAIHWAAWRIDSNPGVVRHHHHGQDEPAPGPRLSSAAWRPVLQRPTQERRHLPPGHRSVGAKPVVGRRVAAFGDAGVGQGTDVSGEGVTGRVEKTRRGKEVHLGAAPGLSLSDSELRQVRHHAVLGHGLAVQAIRARGPAGTKVGFAENIRAAVPLMDTPEYVAAAEKATRERNAGYMTVMLEGRYTDEYLAEAGNGSPRFTDEELRTISSPVDFVGINVYKPGWYVEPSDQPPGYHDIPVNASHPKMFSSWHVFDPEVLYWAPRQMQSIWGATSIYITENGCGASDQVADDGRVYDSDRVMFLRACLGQLQRATAEGVPVDGYFLWSAQDNFEWMDGYGTRFGLIYVDFDTLERTPKLSAEWFREASRRNAVV